MRKQSRGIKKLVLSAMFMAGAFLTAIPGIIVQLILIPGIMAALKRVGVLNADGTCQEH